jgi:glycosyltransferase involved in cell wall biosynthesis
MLKYQFNNHNGLGDTILATCLPRDIKNAYVCNDCGYEFVAMKSAKCRRCEANIKAANENRDERDHEKYIPNVRKKFNFLIRMNTFFPLVWKHNPWLDEFDAEDQTVGIGPGMGTQMSNSSGLHACNNYRISVENALGITIPQGPPYPDLHLSEAEKSAPPEIDRRYWLLTRGGKEDFTAKIWAYDRWQSVVDALPKITFVQIGLREHFHPPLRGKNVINMVGETEDRAEGVRRLFKLFYHCDGSVGLLSAHMHIAAASPFHKPCVVVAGAREPACFEQYNFHRYLNTGGWVVCPKDPADERTRGHTAIETVCWRRSVEACPNKVRHTYEGGEYYIARCVDMITAEDVIKAIKGYYEGGMLAPIETTPAPAVVVPELPRPVLSEAEGSPPIRVAKQVVDVQTLDIKKRKKREEGSDKAIFVERAEKSEPERDLRQAIKKMLDSGDSGNGVKAKPADSKVFKVLCNAHTWGGGERSATTIIEMMLQRGYQVHLYPSKYDKLLERFAVGYEFGLFLEEHPEIVLYSTEHKLKGEYKITDPCAIFLVYANDLVFKFNEPRFACFARLQAKRKVMILNYKIGKTAAVIHTRQWDKYGFLSNTLRSEFVRLFPEARTFALAPPVNNQPYLERKLPQFQPPLHFVKVSSQGDNKHPEDTNDLIDQIRKSHPDARFSFMPAPSFLDTQKEGIFAYRKNEIPVIDFLAKGNIFWYPLPDNYTDQGPRVIIEAMSLGLPAIADNRDGAKERIIPNETGWLCNSHSDYAEILKDVTVSQLWKMGLKAKERAARIWKPENWLEHIIG